MSREKSAHTREKTDNALSFQEVSEKPSGRYCVAVYVAKVATRCHLRFCYMQNDNTTLMKLTQVHRVQCAIGKRTKGRMQTEIQSLLSYMAEISN